MTDSVHIRPLEDTDIGEITALDEAIGGGYRPEVWERRIAYYVRRDPEGSVVATAGGRLVGFMLGEVRAGEFGLEEPSGWIEVVGVDPEYRRTTVGRQMAEALLEHFRRRGAQQVRTLVHEDMTGIAGFFESLGFSDEPIRSLAREL